MGNSCRCLDCRPTAFTSGDDLAERILESGEIKPKFPNFIGQSYRINNIHTDVEKDPTIAQEKWYFGKISRRETISQLTKTHKAPGTYLVRRPISVKDCAYVLSILNRKGNSRKLFVKNIKIYMDEQQRFYLREDFKSSSVGKLLSNYKSVLGTPCVREDVVRFGMDPIVYRTDKGEMRISRQLVYCLSTNSATVELLLNSSE